MQWQLLHLSSISTDDERWPVGLSDEMRQGETPGNMLAASKNNGRVQAIKVNSNVVAQDDVPCIRFLYSVHGVV